MCRRRGGFLGGRLLRPGRVFARVDGRAVATDMPNQFIPEVLFDQGCMHLLPQVRLGKLVESPREGRFRRQRFAEREPTDAAQRTVDRQALDQPHGGRQSQHCLGHKGVRQPRPLEGRTPHTTPRFPCEFFDAHPFQRVDDLLQLRRQRLSGRAARAAVHAEPRSTVA